MIAAVVLAAGKSVRMGRPKLDLPWEGGRSIIGHMADTFLEGGASPIVVVTGGNREVVEAALSEKEVILAYNPDFETGEMISSVKIGLEVLEGMDAKAALIAPGDLPSLRSSTVKILIQTWRETSSQLIAPSYEKRRGHPILVARSEWGSIQGLRKGETLRDFLRQRENKIAYTVVNDPGILNDLDTPEDYQRALADEPRS